jgi:Cu/Ag efflux protein CusF
MKKILATLVASVAFAAAAFAGEAEGVVKAYDEATKTVTLEDGQAFTVAEGVALEGVVAGAKVKVTFDDATKAASAVEVAKM